MARPICAYIDLEAARHNLAVVRRLTPNRQVMAVVKANGYGHGVTLMARGFADADAFAVASLGEAMELRYAGVTHPIVLLEGVFSSAELEKAFHYQLDIVVHNEHQLSMLASCQLLGALTVWLKIDTGMHRLGFDPDVVASVWKRLSELSCVVKPVRLMTHFAAADEPEDGLNDIQKERFLAAIAPLPDSPMSMANSAAIIHFPDCHADWVRPGVMLYGVSPIAGLEAQTLDLKPVMTLMSEVISLKSVAKGEYVGYAGSWCAERATDVAIIAVGYGDGYPRHAMIGTPVLIAGQVASLIGRVSMDMIAVDVTGLVGVGIGSAVTLWGQDLPIEAIAQCSETIAYELLCGVTRRVPCIEGSPPRMVG
jgi:alanine racemase